MRIHDDTRPHTNHQCAAETQLFSRARAPAPPGMTHSMRRIPFARVDNWGTAAGKREQEQPTDATRCDRNWQVPVSTGHCACNKPRTCNHGYPPHDARDERRKLQWPPCKQHKEHGVCERCLEPPGVDIFTA